MDNDLIQIEIDTKNLGGSINFVGSIEEKLDFQKAENILKERNPNEKLEADPRLHADTKLWAALQNISGGTWGGCVFDTEEIIKNLHAGQKSSQ